MHDPEEFERWHRRQHERSFTIQTWLWVLIVASTVGALALVIWDRLQ